MQGNWEVKAELSHDVLWLNEGNEVGTSPARSVRLGGSWVPVVILGWGNVYKDEGGKRNAECPPGAVARVTRCAPPAKQQTTTGAV